MSDKENKKPKFILQRCRKGTTLCVKDNKKDQEKDQIKKE
jgi:hypothetical protein